MSPADQHARSRLLPGDQPAAARPGPDGARASHGSGAAGSDRVADASVAGASDLRASLVRAMRVAAEESRAGSIEAVRAGAARATDAVHARAAEDAAALQRRADEDIAAVRAWSDAEIDRVRAEAEARVAARAAALEDALKEQQSRLAAAAEHIDRAVAAFEAESGAFFARLASIDDPAAFAVSAVEAPVPPAFHAPGTRDAAPAEGPGAAAVAPAWPDVDLIADGTRDARTEEGMAGASDGTPPTPTDPRLAALEWSHVFVRASGADTDEVQPDAAAEASEEADDVNGARLSARLADLVPVAAAPRPVPAAPPSHVEPAPARSEPPPEPTDTTRVVVNGLNNVASIASFKRHLARVRGVAAVVVSSGPEGEFVFTAHHIPSVSLREVVPALPGFAARVTNTAAGTLTVSARDPEADS